MVTTPEHLQRLHALLFERGPSFVAAIDAQHRIAITNPPFEQLFGACVGQPCYLALKRRD